MEGLEELWNQLWLIKEENASIDLDGEILGEVKRKGERSLVGKVCSERPIGKDVIPFYFGKFWKVSKSASFMEFKQNIFIITFVAEADKQKVMEGQPWIFYNYLFILKPFDGTTQLHMLNFHYDNCWVQLHNLPLAYMNREFGFQIGRTIGKVIEVDIKGMELNGGFSIKGHSTRQNNPCARKSTLGSIEVEKITSVFQMS